MLNYIKKMIVEKTDLEGKLKRATGALLNSDQLRLDKTQSMLLQNQIEHMKDYLRILKARITYEEKLHGSN